ncbi:hypothetical protein BDV98DRAFT_40287 [Pterulicium gracile]|uniref:Uncharacterized protein n=1 Tax=Pterulicium gracile TaxID=1884261 RepID=A0A5C3R0N9_9AGAR|nr:hypothetical protein BDV98DRAFT_40287 [Pterula gracilis]
MLTTLVLSLVALSSLALASPTPARGLANKYSSPPLFESLVNDTLAHNFTLSAVNKTQSNDSDSDSDVGIPLVLGQAGAVPGASFHVTSTLASYPYNDYPILSLSSSSLRAYTKSGSWLTNATSIPDFSSDAPLRWLTTSRGSDAFGTNYTAILQAGIQYARLAALGRADLWSLCPFGAESSRRQVNLVFNVTSGEEGSGEFVPEDCWDVDVRMVQV